MQAEGQLGLKSKEGFQLGFQLGLKSKETLKRLLSGFQLYPGGCLRVPRWAFKGAPVGVLGCPGEHFGVSTRE